MEGRTRGKIRISRKIFIGVLALLIIYMLFIYWKMQRDFDLGDTSSFTFTLRHNIVDMKYSQTTFVLSSFCIIPAILLYIGILFFSIVQRLRYSKFDPRSLIKISGHLGLILLIVAAMSLYDFERSWSHLTLIPNLFGITVFTLLIVEGIIIYNNRVHGHKLVHMTVTRLLFILIAVLSTIVQLYNFLFFFLFALMLLLLLFYLTDTLDTDIL